MTSNKTLVLVVLLITSGLLGFSKPSFGQTKIDISVGSQADVEAPPKCQYPCDQAFVLPSFARNLSIAGPQGTFATKLPRSAFLLRMEDWRRHAEIYRRSIERKQKLAPDWKKANVTYLVEVGQYEQFFESYRTAIIMDRAGNIRYGTLDE